MPTYFLNIRLGGVGIDDPEGLILDNDDAALAEAEASAHELVAEAGNLGLSARKGAITIRDEQGRLVGTVSFSSSVTVLRATEVVETQTSRA